ncbi:SpoIIE family protein phosphatase [Streptomyces sp. NPDC050658]|uniref:ATP-binding SpoIIE family protein phosphatase n=1 Tax=unclassified Streptomyces TaxID=2593676 RepID=UPI0034403D95
MHTLGDLWGGGSASQRHLTWLNEAGSRIGTTLDLQRTAQEFAEFTVPGLADCAAVDLLDSILRGEEGDRWTDTRPPVLRAMAVAGVPDRLARIEHDPIGEISGFRPSLAMESVMRREPVLVRRLKPADFDRIAPIKQRADLFRAAGVHSYLAVPLIARGVLIGLCDCLRFDDRPPFTPADLSLMQELAAKAAVYVDNARLYERERQRVVSLQRSLLPRKLPQTPGLEVSTCYTAAANTAGVGGDWFDVIPLTGGRTALVVGDVMAHGQDAATAMGRLRAVARTLLSLDIAPERVLARLDLAARDLEEELVATCLIAIHDPADGSYTLSCAGQLPPLLISPDGAASYADVPTGAPLGTGVIPYDRLMLAPPPGSRLVLFTDGLVKSRTQSIDSQLERLRQAAESAHDADALNAVGPASDPRIDESALIVATARHPAPDAELRQWTLPDDGTAPGIARRLIRETLDQWKLNDLLDTTELVVSELVGNALRYGHGPGRLRLLRHDRLVTEVSDTGPDMPQIQQTTLDDEGGRGLQLINMLCRSWGSCRTPDGKVVWAEQDITAPPAMDPTGR